MAAGKASELFKDGKRKGRTVDIRDTFIAASSITHNCAPAAMNEKRFRWMAGLELF